MNHHNPIWNLEESKEALDDTILKVALSSYADIDGERLIEKNEELKKDPRFQLSPAAKRKIKRALKRNDLKHNLIVIYGAGKKGFTRVAVIFLIIIMGFGTTMYVNADFFRLVYNLILTIDPSYTQIEVENSGVNFVDPENYTWAHTFAPVSLPAGYLFDSLYDLDSIYITRYVSDDKYIDFEQTATTVSEIMRVDTENADIVKYVNIGDSRGFLVSKKGIITVTWQIGDVLLSVDSNDDEEIIIQFANDIRLLR